MEEYMIAALKQVAGIKKVDSYQGNIADAMQDTLTQPAALVIYGGAQPKEMTPLRESARGKVTISFSVWLIGKNLRGKKDVSTDVRKLLTLCRDQLNGLKWQDRTLLWQSEALELISNTGACAYEQQYIYTDFV